MLSENFYTAPGCSRLPIFKSGIFASYSGSNYRNFHRISIVGARLRRRLPPCAVLHNRPVWKSDILHGNFLRRAQPPPVSSHIILLRLGRIHPFLTGKMHCTIYFCKLQQFFEKIFVKVAIFFDTQNKWFFIHFTANIHWISAYLCIFLIFSATKIL